MNRNLAEAIMATFGSEDASPYRARFAAFSTLAWRETHRWLDASGLALYFAARVVELGIENAIPDAVLCRLKNNLEQNRERMNELFAEFRRLNELFSGEKLSFLNVKGFSLAPDYCADPAYRFQIDLDFLVEPESSLACRRILEAAGYTPTRSIPGEWEFKSAAGELPSSRDLYRAKRQQVVEIHIEPFSRKALNGRILRGQQRTYRGFAFPALSDPDQFVWQAAHLLKHLCGEWTRAAWLLEFRRFVAARSRDQEFWEELRGAMDGNREMQTALGFATLLATRMFGEFAPTALTGWTVNRLDPAARLWVERYDRDILMAEFPGTKRYLLMPRELAGGASIDPRRLRNKLFPLHRVHRATHSSGGDSSAVRMRLYLAQFRFALMRARFHLIQGLWYLREAPRWNKLLDASRQ
jgi:hypothetical protein